MRGQQPTYTAVTELVKRFDGALLGHDGFKAITGGIGFTLRYRSSVAGNHTEITCAIPERYPLAIYVSREGLARDRIAVRFADPAFEDRFFVEAAPAAVVRQLLDADARTFLVSLDDCRIVTRDHTLVLTLPVWISPADATRTIAGFVAIIGRIRDAFASVDELSGTPREGSGEPFREMPAARDEAHDQAVQRDEVRKLFARHALHAVQRRMYGMLFIAVIVAAIGAVIGVSLTR